MAFWSKHYDEWGILSGSGLPHAVLIAPRECYIDRT